MAHPVKSKKDAAAAAAGDAEAGLLRANVVQTFCRCFLKARASTDVDSMAGGRESKRKRDSAGRAGAPQLKDIMSAIDLELAMKGKWNKCRLELRATRLANPRSHSTLSLSRSLVLSVHPGSSEHARQHTLEYSTRTLYLQNSHNIT